MKVQLEFDKLTPTGIKAAARVLLQKLARAGLQVVDIATDGKTKRASAIAYREVLITFADSQTLTLRVKATGDVFQLMVNGKLTPLAEQSDPDGAAKELALILDKSRAAFQKRMAAMQMKPPEGVKTAAPRLEAVLTQQVAEVKEQIAAAEAELADLQAQ